MGELTFNQRLDLLIKQYKLSRSGFSRRVKIDRQVIDNYMNGALPRMDNFILMVEAFPSVNIEWLLLGKGEMLRDMTDIPSLELGFSRLRHCECCEI